MPRAVTSREAQGIPGTGPDGLALSYIAVIYPVGKPGRMERGGDCESIGEGFEPEST